MGHRVPMVLRRDGLLYTVMIRFRESDGRCVSSGTSRFLLSDKMQCFSWHTLELVNRSKTSSSLTAGQAFRENKRASYGMIGNTHTE